MRTNSEERDIVWEKVEDLPGDCSLLREHLGKFSDFLFRKVPGVKKWKTHSNYLIPIHDIMLSKLVQSQEGVRQQFESNYTTLRSKTETLYKENAQRDGLPFVKHAVVASVKGFDWIYWTLFTWNSLAVLVSIVFDYTSMGRVIEKNSCCWNGVKVIVEEGVGPGEGVRKTLRILWFRGKTKTQYEMLYVPRPDWPFGCPIFCLGIWMRQERNVAGDTVFSSAASSTTVNDTFKELESHWTVTAFEPQSADIGCRPVHYPKDMSSHTCRASSLNECSSDPMLKGEWMDNRAGFEKKKVDTKMNYLHGNHESDRPCALRLSRWPHCLQGGLCPTLDALVPSDRERFQQFSESYFALSIGKVDSDVIELVAIVQVMWYHKWNHTSYFQAMTQFANAMELKQWSEAFYTQFQTLNQFALSGTHRPQSVQCIASSLEGVGDDILSVRRHLESNTLILSQQNISQTNLVRGQINQAAVLSAHSEILSAHSEILGEIRDLLRNNSDLNVSASNKRHKASNAGNPSSHAPRCHPSGSELRQLSILAPTSGFSLSNSETAAIAPAIIYPRFFCISDFIVHWYCRRLFDTAWTIANRDTFLKHARLLGYLKRFMEPGTVINPGQGSREITTIAAYVEQKVIEFLNSTAVSLALRAHDTNEVRTTGRIIRKAAVDATYKRMTYLYKEDRSLFSNVANVTDNVTPAEHVVLFH